MATFDNSGISGPTNLANQTFDDNYVPAKAILTSDTVVCTPRTDGRPIVITGIVGGSGTGLTHFSVKRIAKRTGGTPVTLAADTDFNTPTSVYPDATNNLYQTTLGNTFTLSLNSPGAAGYEIHAQASASTITLALEIGIGPR
jgi:hypothetical protein